MNRLILCGCLTISSGCAAFLDPIPVRALPTAEDRGLALRMIDREFGKRLLPSPVAIQKVFWTDGSSIVVDETPGTHTGVSVNDAHELRCTAVVAMNGQKISDSALVHELMHCSLDLESGDSDHEHVRPEWRYVEHINDVLESAGL